jgi:hypothetical protein
MDAYAVRVELATVLKTISGLRAYEWAQTPVTPPVALPGWPDEIQYVGTYGQGQTRIPDLPLLVVVGQSSQRVAAKRLGEYLSEAGAKSITAKIHGRTAWTSCDVVTVTSAKIMVVTISAVEYLAAEFHLDITGKGA